MIQIFGTNKSFDCKTAQRWFSERRIAVQFVDLKEKEDKLFENQLKLLKQPVCRNGRESATAGLCQKVWEGWK